MRKLQLLFILLVISLPLLSQYKVASKSVSGKKTVVLTQYDKGYVVKADGQRMEGTIQLKIINNDTVEVKLKDAQKEKFKFNRLDLSSFGLISMMSDAKIAKFPAKNFNPGYIIGSDGTKKEGKVALRFTLVDGEQGLRYFAKRILFESGGGQYVTYTADDNIIMVGQQIDGAENVYELYKDGFTRQLSVGALVLMQNPYSTSTNELASGLISEAQDDLAEEVAKATLKNEIKNGGDLENVVDNYEAVKSADLSVSRKEYLVRSEGSNQITILTIKSFREWAEQLFASCSAYNNLEKSEQKAKTQWKNAIESIAFYNASCAN